MFNPVGVWILWHYEKQCVPYKKRDVNVPIMMDFSILLWILNWVFKHQDLQMVGLQLNTYE